MPSRGSAWSRPWARGSPPSWPSRTPRLSAYQHAPTARRTAFRASRARGSRIASGGVLVGALAVALSLSVGPSVPGAGGSPLLDYRALGRGAGEGNLLSAPPPILSIKDKLEQG